MIAIMNLSKSMTGVPILKNISCLIPGSQTTVFLGPSGAGKTVLMKHIIGLLKPDTGQIMIDGEDITKATGKDLYRIRKKFGMLFQDSALFDSMSVAENVAFPLVHHTSLKSVQIAAIVERKLDLVGMPGTGDKFPAELSGGMRKRVALARAIVMEPQIVLFDEPTSGLDPINAASVCEMIENTQKVLGMTYVVISHDIDAALQIAHIIGVIAAGELIAFGTPPEVRRLQQPVIQAFFRKYERS